MSDLKPKGIEIEVGGQKRYLLFTINAIDEIQEKCNAPLFDVIKRVADAAGGKTDRETIQNFRTLVTVLLNDGEEGKLEEDRNILTENEVGRLLTIKNYSTIAVAVLRAYGVSIPEPNELEDDESDEEDPNVETGQ